jgi:hypothetical protein
VAAPDVPKPTASLGLFSRRALLKGSLGGAALLGLGGVGLSLQGSRLAPAPSEALRVLTLAEYSVVAAVAARVCPAPRPDVPGADAIGVALLTDRLLERAGPEATADVKTVLALFENGLTGAMFFERVRPFTALDAEDQDRVLLAWRSSSVLLRRTVYRALSALTSSLYFGDPRVWPGLGYPGPPSPSGLRQAYAAQLVDLEALRAPSGSTEGEGT